MVNIARINGGHIYEFVDTPPDRVVSVTCRLASRDLGVTARSSTAGTDPEINQGG